MSKRSYLLAGLMALIVSLLVVPVFAEEPGECVRVASPGEHEEFGDGWSDHWTDNDNTTNNHELPGVT